jgi:hypothetical protein
MGECVKRSKQKGHLHSEKSVSRKNLTIPLDSSETLMHRAFETSEVFEKTSLKPH